MGFVAELTTTLIVVELAHSPAFGVKVAVTFIPPEGSIEAGDQMPEIPFEEVGGRVTGISF